MSLTGSIDNLTREQAIKKFKELMEENPKLLDNLSYEEIGESNDSIKKTEAPTEKRGT